MCTFCLLPASSFVHLLVFSDLPIKTDGSEPGVYLNDTVTMLKFLLTTAACQICVRNRSPTVLITISYRSVQKYNFPGHWGVIHHYIIS